MQTLIKAFLSILLTASLSWAESTVVVVGQSISAGTAMTTATDTFDRTNAGTLGNLSGGTYSWTQVSGDFDISSNACHNIGGPSLAVLNPAVNQNAYTVQADVNSEGSAYSVPGIVFWYTDSNNYWRALFDHSASQQLVIQQVSSGTPTTRASGGGNPFDSSTTYNLKIITSGTSISLYFNGAGTAQVTHTASSAGSGNVGIYVDRSTGTGYVDNFSAAN